MANVTKTWESKQDVFGFSKSIDINGDYNPQDNSFSLDSAYAYDARKCSMIDLTEMFEKVPCFNNVLEQIDWREVYAEEMAAKEEYYSEEK